MTALEEIKQKFHEAIDKALYDAMDWPGETGTHRFLQGLREALEILEDVERRRG